jgi:peptide/nickel transport system permease protein
MTNYLIRRFFQMIVVVLLATIAIYIILNVAPGGPLSGLRLNADRRARVSDADMARLEAYIGLDKPLVLRYLAWLIGDDWMGADWMYAGLGRYKVPKLGRNGQPLVSTDPETGATLEQFDSYRFWVNPGPPLLNPGYKLWVWGTQNADGQWEATQIKVKPAGSEKVPEDVAYVGSVVSTRGNEITVVDLNNNRSTIVANDATQYIFPAGEGQPLPQDGRWINIAWLTGYKGLLGSIAGYNGSGSGILRGDFGTSWRISPSQPVSGLIRSRLGNTLLLMIIATFFSLIIAIPIGIYSAVHQYSKADYTFTTFAFFGSAMPVFWFGLMLILVFSYGFKEWGLPYMPTGGVISVRGAPPGSVLDVLNVTPGSFVDRVIHILMPALMLSLLYMAGWSRFMRASMLEVLRQDYVRTARAKGLVERLVIVKHAMRNALIPIITIVVFQIPAVFGGAILTETIFSYPGMGRLYFNALGRSDWPVVMAILFISAILVVVATLLGDVLYTVVDPRIRYS